MRKPELTKKRVKPRKNTYFGEQSAKTLLDWVYDPATNKDHLKMVLPVIEWGRAYHDSKDRNTRERLRGKINTTLVGLRFYPIVVQVKGIWSVIWEAEKFGETADAVRAWLELVSRGLLGRLRRCARKKCRKWFFARFEHASFCSLECRDEAAKEDPVRQAKRKEYERDYYQRVLAGNRR